MLLWPTTNQDRQSEKRSSTQPTRGQDLLLENRKQVVRLLPTTPITQKLLTRVNVHIATASQQSVLCTFVACSVLTRRLSSVAVLGCLNDFCCVPDLVHWRKGVWLTDVWFQGNLQVRMMWMVSRKISVETLPCFLCAEPWSVRGKRSMPHFDLLSFLTLKEEFDLSAICWLKHDFVIDISRMCICATIIPNAVCLSRWSSLLVFCGSQQMMFSRKSITWPFWWAHFWQSSMVSGYGFVDQSGLNKSLHKIAKSLVPTPSTQQKTDHVAF